MEEATSEEVNNKAGSCAYFVFHVFILPIVTNIVNTLDMPTNSRC